MKVNPLKLNSYKTEIIFVGTSILINKLELNSASLSVYYTLSVQWFMQHFPIDSGGLRGVLMYSDLSLKYHVLVVSVRCLFSATTDTTCSTFADDFTVTLAHEFVSSRLDYCCSLVTGSPKIVTDSFQWVVNAAARVITNTRNSQV